MKKYIAPIVAAFAASLVGFVIHVAGQEWMGPWVAAQMVGIPPLSLSWDVRVPAAISSIEYGIGLVIVYHLVRERIPSKYSAGKGLLLGVLMLMLHGNLVRQPLMDFAIGNPIHVVLVQNGVKWATWLFMCVALTLVYDFLRAKEG